MRPCLWSGIEIGSSPLGYGPKDLVCGRGDVPCAYDLSLRLWVERPYLWLGIKIGIPPLVVVRETLFVAKEIYPVYRIGLASLDVMYISL